jgi:hypothetical protein
MKARSALFLTATLALACALSACTPNGGSIYATIETEQKVVDSTLPKTITVCDLVNNSTAPTYPYYVAAGAIYKGTRPNADNKMGWPSTGNSAKPVTPPVSDALCNTIVLFNGELWGGFFSTGSILGLYSSNLLSFAGRPAVSGIVKGKQVISLQATDNGSPGQLFVCTGTVSGGKYVYQLSYFDSVTWSPLLTDLPDPVNGVVWDPNPTGTPQYLMVSGSKVYSDTNDPPVFAETTLPGVSLDSSDELRAIFVDSANDRLFIPTRDNGVYVRKLGIWSQAPADDVNGNTVEYLAVAGPVNGAGNKYLVGSDGYGYYTLDISTMKLTRFDDNTILLYSSAVRRILVDGTTVLMGTAGNGLWSATFNPATGDLASDTAWVHE